MLSLLNQWSNQFFNFSNINFIFSIFPLFVKSWFYRVNESPFHICHTTQRISTQKTIFRIVIFPKVGSCHHLTNFFFIKSPFYNLSGLIAMLKAFRNLYPSRIASSNFVSAGGIISLHLFSPISLTMFITGATPFPAGTYASGSRAR